jgi:hypothetical protein
MPRPITTEQFWQKMSAGGPDDCWEWQGCRHHQTGYGTIRWGRRTAMAHRVAFEIHSGKPIPGGLKVLHRCDNRPCCNPNHLFLGTQHENVLDMVAKGRNPNYVGERNPRAKLSEIDVIAIRAGGYDHLSNRAVSKLFGVTDVLVGLIRRKKIWTHI